VQLRYFRFLASCVLVNLVIVKTYNSIFFPQGSLSFMAQSFWANFWLVFFSFLFSALYLLTTVLICATGLSRKTNIIVIVFLLPNLWALFLTLIIIRSAGGINLTQKTHNIYMYVSGEVTTFGFVYTYAEYLLMFAVFAILYILNSNIKGGMKRQSANGLKKDELNG